MKFTTSKVLKPKTLIAGVGTALTAAMVLTLSPLSASSAAAPILEVTTSASKSSALYSGDTAKYSVEIKNTGTEVATIAGVTSTLPNLTAACQAVVGNTVQPGGTATCSTDEVSVSGLPAGTFVVKTSVEAISADQMKATFESTNSINLWWYGRIPGYWKNHTDDWSTQYAPDDFLQDIFTIPEVLLTNGVLDNDSIPGKDTLLSTLTYQGGVTLKGASQILLRAASAAVLNEVYYGRNYPGAPSVEYLIARTNVVLASQNKAQYIVLAGYFEKWNNGVRTSLAK